MFGFAGARVASSLEESSFSSFDDDVDDEAILRCVTLCCVVLCCVVLRVKVVCMVSESSLPYWMLVMAEVVDIEAGALAWRG